MAFFKVKIPDDEVERAKAAFGLGMPIEKALSRVVRKAIRQVELDRYVKEADANYEAFAKAKHETHLKSLQDKAKEFEKELGDSETL